MGNTGLLGETMATLWWVGAYIEEAAGVPVTGDKSTAYLPFVFSAPDHAAAVKGAAARLLAGPFNTQAEAQKWADDYERNPKTFHATSSGNKQGDKAPAPIAAAAAAVGGLSGFLSSTWPLRIGEILLGLVLVAVGVAKLVPAFTPAQMIAKRVGAMA